MENSSKEIINRLIELTKAKEDKEESNTLIQQADMQNHIPHID